jgi:uncharacterized protein YraI
MNKRYTGIFLLMAICVALLTLTTNTLWAITLPPSYQQEEEVAPQTVIGAAECSTTISQFWLTASDACVGKPFGFVCNGGTSPVVQPEGTVSSSLASVGALVEVGVVKSIHTAGLSGMGDVGGIGWLRVSAENSPLRFSGLIVGDVNVQDVTPEGFPAWQSLVVETTDSTERCELAPHSSLILQSLPGQPSRVVVNGVSLEISGTSVIQTENNQTHFMAISGTLTVLSAGQRSDLFAGQEVTLDYNPDNYATPINTPGLPNSFREERVENLPVVLLDFPVQVPQAGSVSTLGAVNLRTSPNLDAAVIVQAPAGERLTVLGRNPEGDWYHVQLADGQSGWMFRELLSAASSEIENVYVETPQPLQRMGELGSVAQVIAPNGVTMRDAPDISFGVIGNVAFGERVNLLNRSPYSPWIKVDSNGRVGWVPLIAMETRAIIDALPVDYNVPPPPEPTRIPGSFGNAFPDPNCYPNC